jgi:hypothetical protein
LLTKPSPPKRRPREVLRRSRVANPRQAIPSIVVDEEDVLSVAAALRDVMGTAGNDDACCSGRDNNATPGRLPSAGAEKELVDLERRHRIVAEAHDGRGLELIWKIPAHGTTMPRKQPSRRCRL